MPASPQKVTQNRLDEFLHALKKLGGTAGNKRLRQALGWDEEFYSRIQGRLVRENSIVPGRGQGGSVKLADEALIATTSSGRLRPTNGAEETTSARNQRERGLYQPLKAAIENWIQRFGFDESMVAETHSRGSRTTGGTFTRPDFTCAGIRRYVFLPKRLEIVTFEVKSEDSIDIMGILEALAHREAANRAYTLYAASWEVFERAPEAERILELAQKYGVGVILAPQVVSTDDWQLQIDAIRHEPDPDRLERFLSDLPSETTRNRLSKWKE